ncbi:MAG: Methyltransferase [Rhizobacter sp.]|nr:Methyltransferase [Rhizobacter sp.]
MPQTDSANRPMFDHDPLSALEALTAAQRLAFGPLAFQACLVLRDRGVLAALALAVPHGLGPRHVAEQSGLSVYATRVLLEAGLGMQLLWRRDGCYHLGKLGRFVLEDEMTRVNFDFMRDVCFQAAAHLDTSLTGGRPAGLGTLGPWATLYEGLCDLDEPARQSWFGFDHFYSDLAFPVVCSRLAAGPPRRLLDVGCNTGRFAREYLNAVPGARVGLVDLPMQIGAACESMAAAGVLGRVDCFELDLLDAQSALPGGYDLVWMSQLLDCFSEAEIVSILGKVRAALEPGGSLWILELFWDRQRFEAAAFSLQQTSLYFSCVANGNSQMYDSALFLSLICEAGFDVVATSDGIGGFHTLLECRPRPGSSPQASRAEESATC